MKRTFCHSNILVIVCLLFTTTLFAQTSINKKDIVGVWKTVDDETGRTKSHIQIFKKGANYHGKIIKLLDPETLKNSGKERFEDIKCDQCPAEYGINQPLIGLEIVKNMQQKRSKYAGGSIIDPKKGKVYTCTMWMDDSDKAGNTLKVRGWVAMFYRTQTWYRVK